MGALSQSQWVVGKLIDWWLGESKTLLVLVKNSEWLYTAYCWLHMRAWIYSIKSNTYFKVSVQKACVLLMLSCDY